MPGVYGIPDSQGREQGSRPKGTDCQERKNPRKEAGSKCDSWCPGQRGCSGNRDKLNSQGLGIWEQNLSVAKMEWFEEQLNFTSKSNIFSTGCLNTKIPPLTEGTVRVRVHVLVRVCVCTCVCMRACMCVRVVRALDKRCDFETHSTESLTMGTAAITDFQNSLIL